MDSLITSKLSLAQLNSGTKYPSIPTHHVLGERGRLTEELTASLDPGTTLYVTEKVDGTNARLILDHDGDWVIGSREHLLTARGDRVQNPALGIVPAISSLVGSLATTSSVWMPMSGEITTFYLEVHGGTINGSGANYTGTGAIGYRLFDAVISTVEELNRPPQDLAAWRDHGGQHFLDEWQLISIAQAYCLPLVPRVATIAAEELPTDLAGTLEWMASTLGTTRCALDDGADGRPEGLVLRTRDRSTITKLRFEDYARSLRAVKGR